MELSAPEHPGSSEDVPRERVEAVVRFLGSRAPSGTPSRTRCSHCGSSIDSRPVERDGIVWSRLVLHLVSAHGLWWSQLEEIGSAPATPRAPEPFSSAADPSLFGAGLAALEARPRRIRASSEGRNRGPSKGKEEAPPADRSEVTEGGERQMRGEGRRGAGGVDRFGMNLAHAAEAISVAYAIPPQLAGKIVLVAGQVGAHPFDLANEINFETGGTFSPGERNRSGSGAVGLVQFLSSTAKDLGTTSQELAGMSAVEQMDWVRRYLDQRRGGRPLDTPQKVAMSVFYPAATYWPADRVFPAHVTKGNPGIRTPADYLAKSRSVARLPFSDGGAESVAPDPEETPGVLDWMSDWLSSWFSPSTGPSSGSASWDLAAGASGVLVDPSGRTWDPGPVPPGDYKLQTKSGLSAAVSMEAGARYRASAIGRLFKI